LSQDNRMWNKSTTYKNLQNFTLQNTLNILCTVLEVITVGYYYRLSLHIRNSSTE
jgi:hypothetical protein